MSQAGNYVSGASIGAVLTLEGNTGGKVSPDGTGNIEILGDGVVIGTVGNPSGNSITIFATGLTLLTYTAVSTSPYVVQNSDQYLGVNSSSGAITIELPNDPETGRVYQIKDSTGSAATHNITVTTVGGTDDIDGATTFVMDTAYQAISVIWNASSYEIF